MRGGPDLKSSLVAQFRQEPFRQKRSMRTDFFEPPSHRVVVHLVTSLSRTIREYQASQEELYQTGSETTPRNVRPDFVEEHGEHSSSVRQIGRGAVIDRSARARIAIVAGCVRTTNDSMGRQTGDCKIFEIQLTV